MPNQRSPQKRSRKPKRPSAGPLADITDAKLLEHATDLAAQVAYCLHLITRRAEQAKRKTRR